MTEETAMHNLATYWREQAEHWAEQEKEWREVVLFCQKIKAEPSPEATTATTELPKKETGDIAPTKPQRDPATLKTIGDLRKALLDDFKIKSTDQLAELNISAWTELTLPPAEAYTKVAASRR